LIISPQFSKWTWSLPQFDEQIGCWKEICVSNIWCSMALTCDYH
jgi:hypothetical protein